MLLNNFKTGAFKVFGDTVELNLKTSSKNTTHLSGNLIENSIDGLIVKNLKTALIYGGNNTGKSSLLDALMTMKKLFLRGNAHEFPLKIYRNFCFAHDNVIKFELDFNDGALNYIYGIELETEDVLGEYLFVNEQLIFSRALNGETEGILFQEQDFKNTIDNLPANKLIVPYFLEYRKNATNMKYFKAIKTIFSKILFVDNRLNLLNFSDLLAFMEDERKAKVLDTLIKSTELYMLGRKIITEEELLRQETFRVTINDGNVTKELKTDDEKKDYKSLIDSFRVLSIYEGKNKEKVVQPSVIFDSVGTNKFLNLAVIVINALFEGHILLIDEFDSSLHHKLTRELVILMNSSANTKAQFILTTHDVNLLSSILFRKDQINFIVRDKNGVDLVSLDEYKANSDSDIRSTSNFEKMYVEEKIVPLPGTNIHSVIKEFNK